MISQLSGVAHARTSGISSKLCGGRGENGQRGRDGVQRNSKQRHARISNVVAETLATPSTENSVMLTS